MTDAHCHPRDLLEFVKDPEAERRESGTAAAASSWNLTQFEYHENLALEARADGAPALFRCFALHPQLSPSFLRGPEEADYSPGFSLAAGLELLWALGREGRLDAVGEAGFDLYGAKFRAGEKIQEEMFTVHLEAAGRYELPLVIHARRSMHKIFPHAGKLKKLPAVIFHSWPGTRSEGEALLRKGINAFFSFGAAVLNNHREAMASAALFPRERILLETDAPYQPPRGGPYSSWKDLPAICSGIAALRKSAGSACDSPEELEAATTANFYRAFGR